MMLTRYSSDKAVFFAKWLLVSASDKDGTLMFIVGKMKNCTNWVFKSNF